MQISNKVADIWAGLGTFWDTFEDKALVEVAWQAIYDYITEMYSQLAQIYKAKSISTMSEVWDTQYQFYDLVISGLETAINTTQISGLHNFYVDDGTFSIPTIFNDYLDNVGDKKTETLTEGLQYNLREFDRIEFANDPPFIYSNDRHDVSWGHLYAPLEHKINPVLFPVHGAMTDVTRQMLISGLYASFDSETDDIQKTKNNLKHFKYLIWALMFLKQQKPTIENINWIYSIARGLPFTYVSGICNVDNQVINIGVDSYEIPSGITLAVVDGDPAKTFEPLASGIDVIDWIADSAAIEALISDTTQLTSTILINEDSSLSILDYEQSFLNSTISGVIPEHLSFTTQVV